MLLTAYMGCIFATYALTSESSFSDLIVNPVEDAVYPDHNLNVTTFEVYAGQSGKYHAEFWLLPAKYADGSYTRFSLFVNGEPAGTITPSEGNWQSASIDNGGTLDLLEGKNIVSIGTPAPEIPSVETIKIAANADEARISAKAYNSFLNKAIRNSTYQEDYIADIYESEYSTDGENQIQQIDNVPLKYTFYRIFSFTKGQDIFLTSTSSDEHIIDMVYYGTECDPRNNIQLNNTNSIINPVDTIPPISPTEPAIEWKKGPCPYILASSEEMQGLNWRGPSEKALNSRTHIAKIHETIPKTGVYFVRIRHKNRGSMGVVSFNVNGTYYYENVPMTFTFVPVSMPADNVSYESFTISANPDIDDPILFVHGAGADKVVGINDDTSRSMREFLDLSYYDSYIAQQYRFKTTGLSVSNYRSSTPESECTIITNSPKTNIPYKPSLRTKDNQTNRSNDDLSNTRRSITLNNDSETLSISSLNTEILHITAYDMFGKKISSIEPNGHIVSVPLSSLGLNGHGTYIIFVETAGALFSKKIMLR